MNVCCYHCENRKVGCHSHCEEYKRFKEEYNKKQKAYKEDTERHYAGCRYPKKPLDKTRRYY